MGASLAIKGCRLDGRCGGEESNLAKPRYKRSVTPGRRGTTSYQVSLESRRDQAGSGDGRDGLRTTTLDLGVVVEQAEPNLTRPGEHVTERIEVRSGSVFVDVQVWRGDNQD